jgi:hypothetical protein
MNKNQAGMLHMTAHHGIFEMNSLATELFQNGLHSSLFHKKIL